MKPRTSFNQLFDSTVNILSDWVRTRGRWPRSRLFKHATFVAKFGAGVELEYCYYAPACVLIGSTSYPNDLNVGCLGQRKVYHHIICDARVVQQLSRLSVFPDQIPWRHSDGSSIYCLPISCLTHNLGQPIIAMPPINHWELHRLPQGDSAPISLISLPNQKLQVQCWPASYFDQSFIFIINKEWEATELLSSIVRMGW
jgi:hypothetical protein